MEKKIILFLSIYLILINPLLGKSIEIKVKVLNEVITNYDIKEEEKYEVENLFLGQIEREHNQPGHNLS